MKLIVPRAEDFELTGDGQAAAWEQAQWQPLTRVGDGAAAYDTRAKLLYSPAGLYLLADCQDERLTCTITEDNANIFQEDVIEMFLWPSESQTVYFEYEISPLGVELPILAPNVDGRYYGWLPWNYSGARKTRRATAVRGGPKQSLAKVEGWSVEVFIPFALLSGLGNTPPGPGTVWRANIYRIDYDLAEPTQWAWCPATGENFHDFHNFGTIQFA